MKKILNISVGNSPSKNYQKVISFDGQKIYVKDLGIDYNLKLMNNLIDQYDGDFDVISVSGLPPQLELKNGLFIHNALKKVKLRIKKSLFVDGSTFKDIYYPWVIRKYANQNPELLNNKKVGFYSALFQMKLLSCFEDFSKEVLLADFYFLFNIKKIINSSVALEKYFRSISQLAQFKKISKQKRVDFYSFNIWKSKSIKDFLNCDVFVANAAQMDRIVLNDLSGKTFVLDYLTPKIEMQLKQANVKNIITSSPEVMGLSNVSYPLLEAIFQVLKKEYTPIINDDIFDWIELYNLKPELKALEQSTFVDQKKTSKKLKNSSIKIHSKTQKTIIDLNEDRDVNTNADHHFAFIVHPLEWDDLLRHKYLKKMKRLITPFSKTFERSLSYAPGFLYGTMTGIKSKSTGKEICGYIYAISSTPKILLESRPEKVYNQLVKICHKAKIKGAKIIGLGAYTKIVGDAGVSIANKSPIPVTTGNSLSTAATLWAAAYVVDKMGFVKKNENIYNGRAMVIGATGSIGKVTAKLLSQSWKELIVVAPKGYKLLELTEQISEISPKCKISISTSAEHYIAGCDLIITSTSAQGQKILEIENVSPGCVLCDVSRPFDISECDAIKRPDILVIASGEVILPGKTNINCDLGLHGSVVYACLAETALLCLEGQFENFTISRELDFENVRYIDRLARKHGIELSAIMGHKIEITDDEINLCRNFALREKKTIAKELIKS